MSAENCELNRLKLWVKTQWKLFEMQFKYCSHWAVSVRQLFLYSLLLCFLSE